MPSDDQHDIRPMSASDRPAVEAVIRAVGNFNPAEIECALELVDIYLGNWEQQDYRISVASDRDGVVRGYACWGAVPLTRGTFDLYWIATHPGVQGKGFGRALMNHVESRIREQNARLLVLETSGKPSYAGTVRFYRLQGYEEVSRIQDFYDVGDDKLTFLKRISR
jgi:ribosomal protein S18 acetylase RimI-like enzyme